MEFAPNVVKRVKLSCTTQKDMMVRVLKPHGSFIFKWNETDIKVEEPLKLFPYPPMFGTRTGQKNNTHWICFIKSRQDMTFMDFERADEV